MDNILTKDAIYKVNDVVTEVVKVPEWGGSVIVGVMSGTARDAWEISSIIIEGNVVRKNLENMRARLVCCTIQDGKGNLIFSLEDAVALGKKSGAALDRIFTVAQRINELGPKDVDDLAKNLLTDLSEDSISD